MDCPCGSGCNLCKNGKIEITGCPLERVDWKIRQVILHSDIYEKGLPVVAGGQLDQTQWFLEAHWFIMAEKSYWKKKFGIF